MKSPDVRVVVNGSNRNLARLFIDGNEVGMLTSIKYSGEVVMDDIRTSKLEITFIGDIIVERGDA